MNFDDLDARMRAFETAHDHSVLPGIWMAARIDGRGFTRLAREIHQFVAPFDERFRNLMVATTEHLMNCGFRVTYGYTQSDEISLLFARDEDTFNRKLRKYESILAGEASVNPLTGQNVTALRRRIRTDFELPMKEAYSEFICGLIRCSKEES